MASQKSQDFDAVFAQLRQILAKYASRLKLSEDTESRYGLEGGLHPKHNQLMPLAWISIDKNYVSYHLMPVYGCPKLLDNISKKLRARMQGKSCFNFKTVDEELFRELDQLTAMSFDAFQKAGYLPEWKPV